MLIINKENKFWENNQGWSNILPQCNKLTDEEIKILVLYVYYCRYMKESDRVDYICSYLEIDEEDIDKAKSKIDAFDELKKQFTIPIEESYIAMNSYIGKLNKVLIEASCNTKTLPDDKSFEREMKVSIELQDTFKTLEFLHGKLFKLPTVVEKKQASSVSMLEALEKKHKNNSKK